MLRLLKNCDLIDDVIAAGLYEREADAEVFAQARCFDDSAVLIHVGDFRRKAEDDRCARVSAGV